MTCQRIRKIKEKNEILQKIKKIAFFYEMKEEDLLLPRKSRNPPPSLSTLFNYFFSGINFFNFLIVVCTFPQNLRRKKGKERIRGRKGNEGRRSLSFFINRTSLLVTSVQQTASLFSNQPSNSCQTTTKQKHQFKSPNWKSNLKQLAVVIETSQGICNL